MRLTKHRQEILATLEHSHGALTAQEIHSALPHINLVTIYRNLETFVASDLVKKLHLGEAEASYEIQEHPHHHAICDECGNVIHFTVDEAALLKHFKFADFTITDLDITVHGTCRGKHLHQKDSPQTK
jgi:Fe2+ or Zn2+ uptake regulation protein